MSSTEIFQLKNSRSEFPRVSVILDTFIAANHLSEQIAFDIHLVIDELLANVISYGYNDRLEHIITVHLRVEINRFHAIVEDDGEEFNPLLVPAPNLDLPLEERRVGGLGIYLVRKLMDHVEYQRRENKNYISVSKTLTEHGE